MCFSDYKVEMIMMVCKSIIFIFMDLLKMVESMKKVAKIGEDLTMEERNLLSAGKKIKKSPERMIRKKRPFSYNRGERWESGIFWSSLFLLMFYF
uniref:Putative 14-3-3 domain-containing protein n=1 Tax=Helianthus annuus TaxID=4232 RepID=A0A251T5J5_HELAN